MAFKFIESAARRPIASAMGGPRFGVFEL